MCHPCQVAGYVNAEANRSQFYSVEDADAVRAIARKWHKRCKHKNCSCQHVLGNVFDPYDTAELPRTTQPPELDDEPVWKAMFPDDN